jgi:hypothetical protein
MIYYVIGGTVLLLLILLSGVHPGGGDPYIEDLDFDEKK